jgi:hypothetical protein
MLPESFGNACDESSSLVDDPPSQSPMNRSLEGDLESGKPLPVPVVAGRERDGVGRDERERCTEGL